MVVIYAEKSLPKTEEKIERILCQIDTTGGHDMKVGKYQIGRYHGIIKKIYEDGTYDYETRFSDKNDFMQSARAISSFLGDYVGLCTSDPKKLVSYRYFIGKDKIIEELTKQECQIDTLEKG